MRDEISQLRQMLTELTRYQLATAQEAARSSQQPLVNISENIPLSQIRGRGRGQGRGRNRTVVTQSPIPLPPTPPPPPPPPRTSSSGLVGTVRNWILNDPVPGASRDNPDPDYQPESDLAEQDEEDVISRHSARSSRTTRTNQDQSLRAHNVPNLGAGKKKLFITKLQLELNG
jgi:hypothetical protein